MGLIKSIVYKKVVNISNSSLFGKKNLKKREISLCGRYVKKVLLYYPLRTNYKLQLNWLKIGPRTSKILKIRRCRASSQKVDMHRRFFAVGDLVKNLGTIRSLCIFSIPKPLRSIKYLYFEIFFRYQYSQNGNRTTIFNSFDIFDTRFDLKCYIRKRNDIFLLLFIF